MKSAVLLSAVLASACATAGAPLALREHATPPALALSTEPAAQRSFPERLESPRLPTADRSRLGMHTAAIRLCVAPTGAVQSLVVERSSGSTLFDEALAADIPGWQYEPYAAPASLRVCERMTVAYRGR